jgi:endonuclease III
VREAPVEIIARLKKEYPGARIALRHSNPMELLAATILSAQCTDARVNIVTKDLFKKYRTVRDYARADIKALEQDVRSTGFYHNKARNIKNSAGMILEKFGGKVPRTMEEILELPGVARKTANIVLGNAYGVVEGIAVDTHVRRCCQRLGLTRNEDPVKIERDLMKLVPRSEWFAFSYLIQSLGRDACPARKPECPRCVLNALCPTAKNYSKYKTN